MIVLVGVLLAGIILAVGFVVSKGRMEEAKTTTGVNSKPEPTIAPTPVVEDELQKELDEVNLEETKIEIEGASEL